MHEPVLKCAAALDVMREYKFRSREQLASGKSLLDRIAAMLRKVVNNHGGELNVKSNEITGTEFTVNLPRI